MEIGGIGDYCIESAERTGMRLGTWRQRLPLRHVADARRQAHGVRLERAGRHRTASTARGGVHRARRWPLQRSDQGLPLARADRHLHRGVAAHESGAGVRQHAGCRLALHTSQSVFEFDAMVQRHGMTPIEWLESNRLPQSEWNVAGALRSSSPGHRGHSLVGTISAILARHGSTVAHSVWVFIRRGIALENYPTYLAARRQQSHWAPTPPRSR